MADKVVNRRLNIYIDQGTAEQSLAALTKQEEKLTAAIERQKKAGRDATAEMNRLAATKQRIGELKDVMDGKLLPSVKMAEAAVQKLNRELKQLPANGEAAARKLQELRAAEATLSRVRNAANGVNDSLNNIATNQGLFGKIQNFFGSVIGQGGLLAGGILAGGAVTGAAIDFLSQAVDEAIQAEEAAARLRATLDNLGKSDAFARISGQADQLATSIGYLDNDDILGVFDKLVTYGKLTEDQMSKLAPIIIDFAAKQRIDLSEATDVVIKALEGNAKALKTYGINMKDAGSVTEAYGIILDQLAPKVEGAAKAFGETTAGQIAKTKQEIADLKEEIGTNLLPVMDRFYKGISDITGRIAFLYNKASDMSFWEKIKFGFNIATGGPQGFRELNNEYQRDRRLRELSQQAPGLNVPQIGSIDQVTRRGEGLTQAQLDAIEIANKNKTKPKTNDQAKRDREQALRDFREVKNQIEDATAPILSAYRKINEEADAQIKKIEAAFKRGLITKAEADKALDGVQRVLNDQRDALNKKFKLTSGLLDNLPGVTDMDAAMEADVKENGEAMGATLARAIKKGVEDTLKEEDPIKNWLNDPETQETIDNVFYISGQLVDLFTAIGEARSNADRAAFEQEVANNDKRRESAKKLLDQKLISQQEYDRRIANIDKQQDQRQKELAKRQFERDKNANTARAIMQGAAAQLETLSRFGAPIPPNFIGIAASALTLALTAANVIAIRSAKPPQFEKGGFIPGGSSHAQGGISLVDNRTGARVGEVEGGEPILSRRTYARNKPLIDALLAASQSGTGMLSMNVPKLIQARQTVFENGGFIPKAGDAGASQMNNTLAQLTQLLAEGINAKVYYGEYEAKSDRLANIRSQSIVS